MKFLFKNAKIVSTFGPSITLKISKYEDYKNPKNSDLISKSHGIISDVFNSGVNCVRFNFSHGSIEERMVRTQLIQDVQKKIIAEGYERNLRYNFLPSMVFMADTKGPEIRVFKMEDEDGVNYEMGSTIEIHCIECVVGTKSSFSVLDAEGNYNMANDCIVGNRILVDDGKLSLRINKVDKKKGVVFVTAENSHRLKANKRINLPGADYSLPFLSQKDIDDIKFSIDNGYHCIALSFVNSAKNLLEVRKLIDDYCKSKNVENDIKLISKIETYQSCQNIDEIIDNSDGIMVARGDLGLEIPYYQVPYWTKLIISKCRKKKIPVIVATQMLDSIEKNIIPTRAEVSDVYRAVELGTDCTMLSGETAQGLFPVIAVKTMTNISYESQMFFNYKKALNFFQENHLNSFSEDVRRLVSSLLGLLQENKDVGAISLFSDSISPELLVAISSARLKIPVYNFVLLSSLKNIFSKTNDRDGEVKKITKWYHYSLFWGIYNILFSVSDQKSEFEEKLPEIFSDFIGMNLKNSTFEYSPKKIVFLSSGAWKVADVV